MKTPLQIFCEVASPNADTISQDRVRHTALRLTKGTRNNRLKQVGEYMIRCADQKATDEEKGFGSLIYVLMWLRDNAVETYEGSAKATIGEAIKSNWPLKNAIGFLSDTYMVQEYVPAMWKGTPKEALTKQLAWINQDGLRIAVNCSRKNLVSLAFEKGADVYIGASDEGGVVKAKTGYSIGPDLQRVLGSGWVQPYPDMVLTKVPTDDPSEILDLINGKVILIQEQV